MTLSAFVSTYPAAALLLLNPGQGALLAAVAQVHDQLLPLLVRVARQQQQQAVAAPGGSQRVVQGLSHSDLQQLQQYVLGSVFMLLKCGFLSGEGRSKHTSKVCVIVTCNTAVQLGRQDWYHGLQPNTLPQCTNERSQPAS